MNFVLDLLALHEHLTAIGPALAALTGGFLVAVVNGIFNAKKAKAEESTKLETAKLTDTGEFRDELWLRLGAVEDRVAALTRENIELERRYLRLEQKYAALVLVIKALRTDPEINHQVTELLHQFNLDIEEQG